MKCSELIEKVCEKTPIHGTAYFINKKLHIAEKLFWLTIIIAASYFSLNICLEQWQRFRDNPIIYSLQTTWNKKDFPFVGLTLCSDYFNAQNTAKIIKDIWNHEPNTTKFQYYEEFLQKINVMQYDTMHELQPYVNDSTLKKINFLDIILTIRKEDMPNENYTIEPKKILTEEEAFKEYRNPKFKEKYAAAITEFGMCHTTSQYTEYTNPYGKIKHLSVEDVIECYALDACSRQTHPDALNYFNVKVYLHDVFDVASPNDRNTIVRYLPPTGTLMQEIKLSWTAAEDEVRNVPIAYRKCRFPNENNLKYFKVYRPGLCRMECRVNAAINLCNCKPYFYIVARHAPICDIKGMLCLVHKNWTQTNCHANCLELCEKYTHTPITNPEDKMESTIYSIPIT